MRRNVSTGFRATVAGAAILLAGAIAMPKQALAQDVSSETLVYASYDGEKTAGQVFQTIRKNQKATGERIESYAIVSKDIGAKTHVQDQRHRDARVGGIIGAAIGALGGPAGAAAGAAVGGGTGYAAGNYAGIPKEMIDQMKASLTPGTSALIVLLDNKWVQDIDKGLRQANARQVIASQIAAGQTTAPAQPANK